jgi:hypothetical protein
MIPCRPPFNMSTAAAFVARDGASRGMMKRSCDDDR